MRFSFSTMAKVAPEIRTRLSLLAYIYSKYLLPLQKFPLGMKNPASKLLGASLDRLLK